MLEGPSSARLENLEPAGNDLRTWWTVVRAVDTFEQHLRGPPREHSGILGRPGEPGANIFELRQIAEDDDGDVVGYWTSNFKEPEQIEVLRPTAQQMADAMLSAGGGG